MKKNDKIPLAKIGRPRGLKGHLRLDIYNPDSDLFVPGKSFHLSPDTGLKKLTLATCDGQWCTFEEIQNVDDARNVVGKELCLPRDEMPTPKKGSYYHVDLIGCLIIDEKTKATIGALNDILYTASNDVWVVVSESGEETLIPILDKVIANIDLEQNSIFLNIPEVI
jgi:16S rRNA processing protein RimM